MTEALKTNITGDHSVKKNNAVKLSPWLNAAGRIEHLKKDIVRILTEYANKKRFWLLSRANAPLANQYTQRVSAISLDAKDEEQRLCQNSQLRLEIYCLYFNLIANGSWELANSVAQKLLEYFFDPEQPKINDPMIRQRNLRLFNSYREEYCSFFTSNKTLTNYSSTETTYIDPGKHTFLGGLEGTYLDEKSQVQSIYKKDEHVDPMYLCYQREFEHSSLFRREGCFGRKLGVKPTPSQNTFNTFTK
jgi:hypothetical protein